MQLIFAFIILSVITLSAILLTLLSKNTRSGKIRQLAQKNNWQYQEFLDFNDAIKQANFGILNYSQNAVFRHVIQADDKHHGLPFNSFDCRAIEPLGIHNSSLILFSLKLDADFLNLHLCLNRHNQDSDAFDDISNQQALKKRYQLQKLTKLARHQIPQLFTMQESKLADIELHANNPAQAYQFLQQVCATEQKGRLLSRWLLAHPNLHIEISNGMLLTYKKNQLLEESAFIAAINTVSDLANILSQTDIQPVQP